MPNKNLTTASQHSTHFREKRVIDSITLCAVFALISFVSLPASASKCLFISSYHQGYAWADGVERGVRTTLSNKCELKQFNMDTKRNKDEAFAQRKALEAKAIIEE